jgi:hypothetical protein
VSQPSFGELDGQDPYDILELPAGAPDADVRAARKRLLRRYHPDLPSGDLRRTQLITAAADLLLDPYRRIGYYDLRDEESRRTLFGTAGPADDPAPAPAREQAKPSSGAHADGQWFRPRAGADGRIPRSSAGTGPQPVPEPRPSPATGPMPAAAPSRPGEPAHSLSGASTVGSGSSAAPTAGSAAAGREATARSGTIRPTFVTPPAQDGPASTPRAPWPASTPRAPWPGVGTDPQAAPATAGTASTSRTGEAGTAGASRRRRKARRSRANRPAHAAAVPQAASRWNALAVASLVAIVTWTPLPLILGLLALRQIRRYGQRGTRLAITGVVVGTVFTLFYAYILVVPGF